MIAILAGYGCMLAAFLLAGLLSSGDWSEEATGILSLATALLLVGATGLSQITLYGSARPLVRARAKGLTGALVRLGVVAILAAFEITLIGKPSAAPWIGVIRLYTWTIGLGALCLALHGTWEVAGDRKGRARTPTGRWSGPNQAL